MAADRGAYIDQTQSMNLYLADPNFAKISSMHMYAWEKGLKTGMYYLRTKSSGNADKVTTKNITEKTKEVACSLDNKEACESCSS